MAGQYATLEFDITDTCCQVIYCLSCPLTYIPVLSESMGKKKLILKPKKAIISISCLNYHFETAKPYDELASAKKVYCCCFVGIDSDLNKSLPIMPGNGCDEILVTQLTDELNMRIKNAQSTVAPPVPTGQNMT